MASSGSFNTTAYSNRHLTFSWSIKEQSIANNTTTINWTLKAGGTSTVYYASGNFKVVIDGETVYSSATRIELRKDTVVASGTKTITHNTNGQRSFSASAEAGIYTYAVNCKGSGSWELTPIPRQATVTSATDFNDETNPTIQFTNQAGLRVKPYINAYYNGIKIIGLERAVGTYSSPYTWSITNAERETMRTAMKNLNSCEVWIGLETYLADGTVLGAHSINKTFSIINANPTLAPTVRDIGVASTALTGNPNTMIRYFNHMVATANAQTYKGATIKERKITNGPYYGYDNSEEFIYTDSNTFEFKITDSRNNTATKTITVPMIDYIPLTCNVEGKITLDASTSTEVTLSFTVSGNYFNGSFGAVDNELELSYSLEYEGGGASIQPLTIPEGAFNGDGTYSFTYTIPQKFDYKYGYTIQVQATDKIGSVSSSSKTLKAVPVFDWGEEDFNFNVPVKIQGTELDYIVEQGEKNGWTYRNWKSGRGECWKIVTVNTKLDEVWGPMYVNSTKMTRQSYPYPFKSKPTEIATLATGAWAAWIYPSGDGEGVNGGYASAVYNICRPTTVTNTVTFYISLYACGELLNQ